MRYFAFLLLLAFAGCRPAAAPVSVSTKPISINDVPTNVRMPPAKNVETMGWTTSDGKKQILSEMKGKVVVLDFWATYCPPCIEEIPHLVEIQNKYGASGVEVIGLHAGGEEDRAKVPAFVTKLKMNYQLAYPEEQLTETLFGPSDAIPQTFVFDKNGNLVNSFVGFDANVKSGLDRAVDEALAKS